MHGGEPTLCGAEYIRELFAYAQARAEKLGIAVSFVVQTNGLLLDESMLVVLKSFRTTLGVSYDGLHNDLFRGNTAGLVLRNIKSAQLAGIDTTALCVESESSFKDVLLNYEWFKSQGINFKVLPLYAVGEERSVGRDDSVSPETYADGMMALYQRWMFDVGCDIRIPTLEGMLRLFLDRKNPCRMGGDCIGKCFAVMPNGDVGLCSHSLPTEYLFSNVKEIASFEDVIDSLGYHAIRELQQKRLSACSACEFASLCRGGCLANAFLDQSMTTVDGIACRRTKALLLRLHPANVAARLRYQRDSSSFNIRAQEILSCVS